MRYLKRQSTNRRLLRGKGVIYDQYENIEIQSTGALLMPKGTTAQRPVSVVGQLRYNTQTKRLTEAMFDDVFKNIKKQLKI